MLDLGIYNNELMITVPSKMTIIMRDKGVVNHLKIRPINKPSTNIKDNRNNKLGF